MLPPGPGTGVTSRSSSRRSGCAAPRPPLRSRRWHPRVSGDGGYRGVDGVRSPRRGKDRRIIRDRAYKRFARRRAVAEHTLARLKDWQILRQHRMPAGAIDVTATVVAVLHNLNVETSYAM